MKTMTPRVVVAFLFAAVGLASGSARAQVVTEFTTGITGNPYYITTGPCSTGPAQCLWFTEPSSHKVGRITTGGTVTEFFVGSEPWTITKAPCSVVGTSQCLWFAEPLILTIGRIDPSTGLLTEFPLDKSLFTTRMGQITTGPDGNIWFTDDFDVQIGRMKPDGTQTAFSAFNAAVPWIPITAGPDGNLWFGVLDVTNNFGRINPSTGAVVGFSSPPGWIPGSAADRITTGPDGKMWCVYQDGTGGSRIGNIATNGTQTPGIFGSTSFMPDITAGPDGNLWFTDASLAQVGRITTAGVVTDFSAGITNPTWGITTGPDNNLWFTEPSGKIGRIDLSGSNTPVGTNVSLDFQGGAQLGGVSITFTGVTSPGNTGLTTSNPCPAVPSGFQVGNPAVCYDLTTTATYTPPIQVCISYMNISFTPPPPPPPDLMHYDSVALMWTTVTTSQDTTNQIVCGSVNSLSPFVLATQVSGPPAKTTTTLVSSSDPSVAGQPVTFTATVTGNSPGGTVQFMDGQGGHGHGGHGNTNVGSPGSPLGSPVTLNGGVAEFTTSALTQGTHKITAVYSGDAGNDPSTSSVLQQKVKRQKGHGKSLTESDE